MANINAFIKDDVILGAVLKANAYGHGAKYTAKTLYNHGVKYFLVATLLEAIQLRNENANYQLLVMGHTPDDYLHHLINYNIIGTVFTLDQARLLNKLAYKKGTQAKVHLKIETGFNRLGMQINEENIQDILQMSQMNHLDIQGAFTHLTLKSKDSDLNQYNMFMDLISTLEAKGIHIPVKHVCDSIGMALYPEFHLSMVRVGALLYGLQSEDKGIIDVKPILSFYTKPSCIKKIFSGESVSYGNRWFAKNDTIIATLPFGYADGFPRTLYQKSFVTIHQNKYPIVGAICMDQCMIDLGISSEVTTNDAVEILGPYNNIEDFAQLVGTNKNDIVSGFAARIPRVYIKDQKICHIENEIL
ncbi:MAG: alanine racemase [Clostridiales bacterium]|nr:alanine racemase [Clostridiales bacterium]